jgi:hypothetical protein
MRERLHLPQSREGPMTRGRGQDLRESSSLVVSVMEANHSPCSPADVAAGDVSHRRHIVVSEPAQRNIEAARKPTEPSKNPYMHKFTFVNLLLLGYPSASSARICHRIRGVSPSSCSSNSASPSSSTPASVVPPPSTLSRSPTRRAPASSSCPSPLPITTHHQGGLSSPISKHNNNNSTWKSSTGELLP